jgi:CHASE3 domain sensor protein
MHSYTASMRLKTAAFFAFIGMLLVTIVYLSTFLNDLTAYFHDAIAVMTLLAAGIHLLASFTVTMFFFVFYRAQA